MLQKLAKSRPFIIHIDCMCRLPNELSKEKEVSDLHLLPTSSDSSPKPLHQKPGICEVATKPAKLVKPTEPARAVSNEPVSTSNTSTSDTSITRAGQACSSSTAVHMSCPHIIETNETSHNEPCPLQASSLQCVRHLPAKLLCSMLACFVAIAIGLSRSSQNLA